MYARPKVLALGTRSLLTTSNGVVLRVGDAWLVRVWKRAPHWFQCLRLLVSPDGSLDRLNSLHATFPYISYQKTDITGLPGSAGLSRVKQGRAGSDMWCVLLVPSSSLKFLPIDDGLDVNVTSNLTWFHLKHDMVSRRIKKLSFYGGHSIHYRVSEIVVFYCDTSWDMPWRVMGCHGFPWDPMACPTTCRDMPRCSTISRDSPGLFDRLPRHATPFPTVKHPAECHDIYRAHRNMLLHCPREIARNFPYGTVVRPLYQP